MKIGTIAMRYVMGCFLGIAGIPATQGEEVSDAQRLTELRAEVARLEAALERDHQDSPASSSQKAKPSHGPMRQGDRKPMRGMGMKRMQKMKMMGGMMGMMKGENADAQAVPSSLPGFPGKSHLYHIGATGFFLDHQDHLNLSPGQEKRLRVIENESEQITESLQSNIEAGEKKLFELTGADQPDIQKIQAKIKELEQWRSEQRLAFIRSVGQAAQALTPSQRKILVGEPSSQDHSEPDDGSHQH